MGKNIIKSFLCFINNFDIISNFEIQCIRRIRHLWLRRTGNSLQTLNVRQIHFITDITIFGEPLVQKMNVKNK